MSNFDIPAGKEQKIVIYWLNIAKRKLVNWKSSEKNFRKHQGGKKKWNSQNRKEDP